MGLLQNAAFGNCCSDIKASAALFIKDRKFLMEMRGTCFFVLAISFCGKVC